ncbi:MAG: hypothetical protein EBZ55_02545 [Actinobacteria bacterium]|nr:hypothetical protein [Actinomycetota bacterium]
MAPWAGRMRHGEFHFGGSTYRVPCDLPPHAIHGTTYAAKWTVDDVTNSSIVMSWRMMPSNGQEVPSGQCMPIDEVVT